MPSCSSGVSAGRSDSLDLDRLAGLATLVDGVAGSDGPCPRNYINERYLILLNAVEHVLDVGCLPLPSDLRHRRLVLVELRSWLEGRDLVLIDFRIQSFEKVDSPTGCALIGVAETTASVSWSRGFVTSHGWYDWPAALCLIAS